MIAVRLAVACALLTAGCEVLFPFEGSPPDATGPGRWKSVHAGVYTSYALDLDGALWAWGENSTGAIGDGTRLERIAPVMIDPGPWSTVAPGYLFACAIRPDRTAACWGNNNRGQLGIAMPTVSDALAPRELPGTWDAIAAGAEHACGLDAGTVWCWGRTSEGQGGQIGMDLLEPTQVGTNTNWDAITAGNNHNCGHQTDGTLWCWGDNDAGQLGQGTTTPGDSPTPLAVAGPGEWRPPVSRYLHTCAIQVADGSAWCWGYNGFGEIGNGLVGLTAAPALVAGAPGWTEISVGLHHTCGLRGGALACWGFGDYGNLALGDETGAPRDTPTDVAGPAPFMSIALGGYFTCALTADSRLWCAGLDSSGQLGTGEGGDRHLPVPLDAAPWNAVTTGANHSCARAGSALSCWGFNVARQLGDGTPNARQRPTPIPDAGGGIPSGGTLHTCEIWPDGSLWCWGDNRYGQLGQGDNTLRTGKVRVQPGSTWLRVATANHTCGIQADNTLWCWGRNANYTIGNNTTTDVLYPALVATAAPPDTFLAVAVSETHTCAIKTNSRVWCWGLNETGQAGTGNTMPARTPQPTIGVDVDRVAIGRNHTCVRRTSGHSLACWGDNTSGQLGDGTRLRRLQATDIAGARAWDALAAGGASTCAIEETTGALHCWGLNTSGQVGDGSVEDGLEPRPVRPDLTWSAVAPSGVHTCGLAAGGALHCWGDGGVGELGDGTAWRFSLVEIR